MTDQIKGKVILLTGASSGIGWETALVFAERQARLAICARRADRLAKLAASIRSMGTDCLEFKCDVSRRDEVNRTIEAVVRAWGRIDVLINNAGINEYLRFAEQDIDQAEAIIRTNLLGPMYTIRATLLVMKKQRRGHIVNVSSLAGLRGVPFMAAYCASKFGLVGLTESLRVELYKSGITLTAFCPGTVATPMAAKALKNSKMAKKIKAKHPRDIALRILRATERRSPEVVYGEVPGSIVKMSKFFPRLGDWMTYTVYKRFEGLFPPRAKAPK